MAKKMKGSGKSQKSGSKTVKKYDPKNTGNFSSGKMKVSKMHKKGSPEG